MYLTNNTRSDITFARNCLARHSTAPNMHHWNGIKNILQYVQCTTYLGLLFKKNKDPCLLGYTDTGYLSDLHNVISQTGFTFFHRGTAISWKSSKQTLVAMFTNHSEIIVLYKASRECVLVRRIIDHIQASCGIGTTKSRTIIYEDNAACVAQLQMRYFNTNYMKHISLKLFYPHKLTSCDNFVDLSTKSLPFATFDKCVKGIDMH
jgi:hypothetical protein